MTVTTHAVERFRQRTGAKYSVEKIRNKLLEIARLGNRVKLKPPYRVTHLLNHDFQDTDYIMSRSGHVLVIANDTILTIHNGAAQHWEGA